jgi:hypothetical protein
VRANGQTDRQTGRQAGRQTDKRERYVETEAKKDIRENERNTLFLVFSQLALSLLQRPFGRFLQ